MAFPVLGHGQMRPPEADLILADFADRQFGRVARWQLVPLGFDDDAIRHRLNRRQLRTVRRGVYAVGHAPESIRARWMTDMLACGPDSGLGALTTLQLFGAVRESRARTVVITARRGRTGPKGVDMRTARNVEFIDWGGFKTTTLARALLDAAPMLDDEKLEAAYERSVKEHGLDPSLIPKRNKRLNQLIADHKLGTAMTDSELENLFRRILKAAQLPQPLSNQDVWTGERFYKPDFLWPQQKVIVEIDGWEVHRSQREADSRREADLSAMGFHVQRFMKLQLIRHPDEPVRALRPFL